MPKLQDLREDLDKTDGEILGLRDKVKERKADANFKGEILTAEERSSWTQLKDRRKKLKEQLEVEERSADLDELLKFEAEAEERSRRGPSGRFDPNPDDLLPGEGGRTYGDRFGKDRDKARSHAQMEERRALCVSAFAKTSGRFPLSEEERSACHDLKFDPSAPLSFKNWGTSETRRLRAAAGFHNGPEERAARMDRLATQMEERAIHPAADRPAIVPQVTVRAFEMAIVTIGGLVNAADVMVSDNGGSEAFPNADDTTTEGIQIDENSDFGLAGVDPNFDVLMLGIWEFSSQFVRIANSQLRDAPYDIAGAIGQMVALRLGRIFNRKATNEAGSNTVRGLLPALTSGVKMANPAVYGWEELLRLKRSPDEAYRANGSFMLHDDTLTEYMILTDEEGRPLFIEPNGSEPGRLFNRPYVINNHMPSPSTQADGDVMVTYGNHRAYKIKYAGQTRIEAARERFIEFGQTAFVGFRGMDGALHTVGDQIHKLYREDP